MVSGLHFPHNTKVGGSNPLPATNICNNAPPIDMSRPLNFAMRPLFSSDSIHADLRQLHGDINVNCSFWFERFEAPLK
jgi:hypothetical protein